MSDAECWLRIGEFSGGQRIEQEIREFPDTPQAVYFAPKTHRFIPSLKRGFPIRIDAVPDRTRRYPLQEDSELLQC